jgi:hypothetical protein
MRRGTRFLSVGVFGLLLAAADEITLAQMQISLDASQDNTLYESATGALSNGSGQAFFVGRTNQASASIRRGLLAFDIAGNVPADATILAVTLTLNVSRANFSSPATSVGLHRVLASWGEGASDADANEGSYGRFERCDMAPSFLQLDDLDGRRRGFCRGAQRDTDRGRDRPVYLGLDGSARGGCAAVAQRPRLKSRVGADRR